MPILKRQINRNEIVYAINRLVGTEDVVIRVAEHIAIATNTTTTWLITRPSKKVTDPAKMFLQTITKEEDTGTVTSSYEPLDYINTKGTATTHEHHVGHSTL